MRRLGWRLSISEDSGARNVQPPPPSSLLVTCRVAATPHRTRRAHIALHSRLCSRTHIHTHTLTLTHTPHVQCGGCSACGVDLGAVRCAHCVLEVRLLCSSPVCACRNMSHSVNVCCMCVERSAVCWRIRSIVQCIIQRSRTRFVTVCALASHVRCVAVSLAPHTSFALASVF